MFEIYLLDIIMAIPDCFLDTIAWIFFPILYLEVVSVFVVDVCFVYSEEGWIFFSYSFC